MADFKEINAEKFKENLISNFGDNDKVNILFDELVQKNAEKNPFFYSIILNYIERNNINILELVDSKSQVRFDKINVAIVQAKKEFEQVKIQQEKNEYKQKNDENLEKNEGLNENNLFKNIDFQNLTSKDFKLISKDFINFIKSANNEEIEAVMQDSKEFLGTAEQCSMAFGIAHKIFRDEKLSEEEYKSIKKIPEHIANFIGLDKESNKINEDIYKNSFEKYFSLVGEIREIAESKGEISSTELDSILNSEAYKDFIQQCPEMINKDIILEKSRNGEFKKYMDMLIDDANKNINSENKLEFSVESSSKEGVLSFDDLESKFDAMFAEIEDPAYFQESIEIHEEQKNVEEELEKEGNEILEIDIEEKAQEINLKEQVEEMEQESQEGENEKLQEEEEYESPTFDEEKTGLAGLVAAIANSRIGRAVKSLFKTKDAQKRLNAPVTQRTEDGLKITEYESNGSLMPTTIQARNFFRDFAVNTVEAVTNFTKNISNAIRGNQDEVVNRPTIIKPEPVQEQHVVEKNTDKKVLSEKSIINQENAFDRYVKLNPEAQSNFDQNAAIIGKNAAQVATMSKAQTQDQNKQNKDENEGIEY